MPLNDIVRRGMQPILSVFTADRVISYAVFSTLTTVATIANACRTYGNFYSVSVYLSRSGRSLLVSLLQCMNGRTVSRACRS